MMAWGEIAWAVLDALPLAATFLLLVLGIAGVAWLCWWGWSHGRD